MLIGSYIDSVPEGTFPTGALSATARKLNITEAKKYIKANPKTEDARILTLVLKHRDAEAAARIRKMLAKAKKPLATAAAEAATAVVAAPRPVWEEVKERKVVFPQVHEADFGQQLINLPQVLAHQSALFDPIQDAEDLNRRTEEACGSGSGSGSGAAEAGAGPGKEVDLMMHQRFVEKFLSHDTPYKGLLLYHQVGVGKTCSAIAVAESYLDRWEREMKPVKPVIVVASRSLHSEFQRQIFDVSGKSCAGSKYYARAISVDPSLAAAENAGDTKGLKNRVQILIRSRYEFMGYEEFANRFAESHGKFEKRLVIVDEVHNMRKSDATKQAAIALEGLAKLGPAAGNMLLFMTATPMYNEAAEFYQLLALLCWNDGRVTEADACVKATKHPISDASRALIWRLASQYISYVRGTNPIAFPYKMDASMILDREELLDRTRVPSVGWHKNEIPADERMWTQYLPTLVSVPANTMQKKAIGEVMDSDNIIMVLNRELAYNNVVFPDPTVQHQNGLLSGFYMGTDDAKRTVFRSRDAPFVAPGEFVKYAPKLAKVLETAKKCEGIAIIYSQHIWNGILPLALALEYMGYQNWSGNLVDSKELRDQKVRSKKQKYAILCGDLNFTAANLSGVIQEINHESNKNGEKIKFVLISQVASEGISFKNVRSVHVVDPWYHYNRTEQIIGRAVRTCSHVGLPVSQRNVGIFLYALTDGSRETADIYTYRMAAMKRREILELNQEIQRHAVDCYLHRSKNYYPPSAPISMLNPMGKSVEVVLGDTWIGDNYTCSAVPQGRRYLLSDFTPVELERWSRYFMGLITARLQLAATGAGAGGAGMSLEKLQGLCGAEGNRVLGLLFAYTIDQIDQDPYIWNKHIALRVDRRLHRIRMEPVEAVVPKAHVLLKVQEKKKPIPAKKEKAEEQAMELEASLKKKHGAVEQKVHLYQGLTQAIFQWVVTGLHREKVPLITKLLDSEGTFVYGPELEGRKAGAGTGAGAGAGAAVGYFDIFVVEPRLDRTVHPILYLWREGGSRVIEAPVETVDKVVKVRAAKKLASSNAIQLCGGFVVRQSKGAKEPEIRLKMFDLIPGERTKSGFDCRQTSTFGVAIAKEKLAGLGAKVPGGNSKALLCTALAVEMGQISKQNLLFPPYLHPIL